MLKSLRTNQLTRERNPEITVLPAIPSDPVEICTMISLVRERLLHPQTMRQVYKDTFFLSSLIREQLAKEKVTPLVYARRRLAVFELGMLAMQHCSASTGEENRYVFEKLDSERESWDEREWELYRTSDEYTHDPIGFFNQKMRNRPCSASPLLLRR